MTRFAVLIDGDTIGAQHFARIRRIASDRGRVDIWRVYANAGLRQDWDAQPGVRLIHAGAGKNAADMLLSIDAMELALRDGVEGFVIASSDGDFAHIANRLREGGRAVVGVGKTSPCFRAACTVFEAIEDTSPMHKVSELDRKVCAMIAEHNKDGHGMRLAELAPKMYSSHGIRIRSLPESCWRNYLTTRPEFYSVDPKGAKARVRFKPKRFGF